MVKRYAVVYGDFDAQPGDGSHVGVDNFDGEAGQPLFHNEHQARQYATAQGYRGGKFSVVEVVATYENGVEQ